MMANIKANTMCKMPIKACFFFISSFLSCSQMMNNKVSSMQKKTKTKSQPREQTAETDQLFVDTNIIQNRVNSSFLFFSLNLLPKSNPNGSQIFIYAVLSKQEITLCWLHLVASYGNMDCALTYVLQLPVFQPWGTKGKHQIILSTTQL